MVIPGEKSEQNVNCLVLTQMYVVGVLGKHVVVVNKLLRVRSGSRDADEAELANDLFDVFVFPQSGRPKGFQQIRTAEQLQFNVRLCS